MPKYVGKRPPRASRDRSGCTRKFKFELKGGFNGDPNYACVTVGAYGDKNSDIIIERYQEAGWKITNATCLDEKVLVFFRRPTKRIQI